VWHVDTFIGASRGLFVVEGSLLQSLKLIFQASQKSTKFCIGTRN
jgi:hypothetical protein